MKESNPSHQLKKSPMTSLRTPSTLPSSPTPNMAQQPPWPYPRWVAHRGAGKLAPENTLAAMRLGASYGYRMFECDAKLSVDGVPFLLHDATLTRTTNAAQHTSTQAQAAPDYLAGDLPWAQLSQLDAGGWHSRNYAGEPMATLEAVARFCMANGYFLNIEIKPTPGTEQLTGHTVAHEAARLWQGQSEATTPLLSSFEVAALAAAKAAQPQLRRGLLLDVLQPGWLNSALALQCQAVICNHTLWTPDAVHQVQSHGMRALSYTVNDADHVQRLIDLGTDGIITDCVDRFSPA
jgi:glycerophosphoryl diester phosphodiesterase